MNYRNFCSMILPVAIFFLVAAAPGAQAQKDADLTKPAIGAPDVRITAVTNRGVATDDSVLSIRVAWSAEARQITTLLGFEAFVEVEYTDGSKSSGSRSVGASVRQADIGVPNKGSNLPRRFTARVVTEFKVLHPNFIDQTIEFDLNKANGFNAILTDASFSPRPSSEVFSVSRVRLNSGGCPSGKHCFIINWSATPRPGIQLGDVSFNAQINYINQTNETRGASASAPVSARTVTMTCNQPKEKSSGVRVKLTSRVSAHVFSKQNTALTGSF
ncbi:MAG: hypothetical protein AB1631_07890 [Acidobacteriota bacterium]